jgi:hypothetical protein
MSIRIHMTAKHIDNINRIPVYSGFTVYIFLVLYFLWEVHFLSQIF